MKNDYKLHRVALRADRLLASLLSQITYSQINIYLQHLKKKKQTPKINMLLLVIIFLWSFLFMDLDGNKQTLGGKKYVTSRNYQNRGKFNLKFYFTCLMIKINLKHISINSSKIFDIF